MAEQRYAVRIRITGRVQGVSFRAWTQQQAQPLKVDGWIRNEPDGSVLAVLAGRHRDVEALVAKMRVGPRTARVANVEAEPVEDAEIPAAFEIRE